MAITETDIFRVQAKVKPIIGQKAWGVSLGVGSFITMEFGSPSLRYQNQQPVHGEWHLWIYYCAWRLEENNELLAGSEDPRPKLESAVLRIENRTLESVKLLAPAWDSLFIFDKQLVLRLFSIYSEESEHWVLYTPEGEVLSVGPGTTWSCERQPISIRKLDSRVADESPQTLPSHR